MALRNHSDLKPTRRLKLASFDPVHNNYDSLRIKQAMENFDSAYPAQLQTLQSHHPSITLSPHSSKKPSLDKNHWIFMHKRKQQAKKFVPHQETKVLKKQARSFVSQVRDLHFPQLPNAAFIESMIQKNAEKLDKKRSLNSIKRKSNNRMSSFAGRQSPVSIQRKSKLASQSDQHKYSEIQGETRNRFDRLHSLIQDYTLKTIRHFA